MFGSGGPGSNLVIVAGASKADAQAFPARLFHMHRSKDFARPNNIVHRCCCQVQVPKQQPDQSEDICETSTEAFLVHVLCKYLRVSLPTAGLGA